MARSLRIEYAGAFYHVMARGNRRERIFHDDGDYRFLLKTLGDACLRTGWRVHAWVLMGNHYHLFIETPEANLVAGMSWLQNAFTRRYNVRHQAWGRVFGDRYKAVVVEGDDPWHYGTLMDYIHLNPVRARLVRPGDGESVADYPWSSVGAGYALPPTRRPKWFAAESGLGVFDCPDTTAGRRRMVARLDRRAAEEVARECGIPELPEEVDARCSHLRRGWYWGTPAFAENLRELSREESTAKDRISRAYRATPQAKAHDLSEAERLLEAGMAAAGLTVSDLEETKGSDPRKLALADLLWRRTVVSQEWIAGRLHMRSAANVSQQLRRLDRPKLHQRIPPRLRKWLGKVDGKISLPEATLYLGLPPE